MRTYCIWLFRQARQQHATALGIGTQTRPPNWRYVSAAANMKRSRLALTACISHIYVESMCSSRAWPVALLIAEERQAGRTGERPAVPTASWQASSEIVDRWSGGGSWSLGEIKGGKNRETSNLIQERFPKLKAFFMICFV